MSSKIIRFIIERKTKNPSLMDRDVNVVYTYTILTTSSLLRLDVLPDRGKITLTYVLPNMKQHRFF